MNFVQGLSPANLLKNRLWYKGFPVSLVKLLITTLFIEQFWWPLISLVASSLHICVGILLVVLYFSYLYSVDHIDYFWENHCVVFHLMTFERISRVDSSCFELWVLRTIKRLCCLFHRGLS